jgi:superfamily II DNA/RNA helicase
MSQDTFAALGVSAELTAVLEARGIDSPFQIQTRAIPPALAGTDLLA